MKSILQEEKRCFVTGSTEELHKHHIFGGANRNHSEKYGLVIWLIGELHNLGGAECIHQNKAFNDKVKQVGQMAFERVHGTREDFMRIFGRSWL